MLDVLKALKQAPPSQRGSRFDSLEDRREILPGTHPSRAMNITRVGVHPSVSVAMLGKQNALYRKRIQPPKADAPGSAHSGHAVYTERAGDVSDQSTTHRPTRASGGQVDTCAALKRSKERVRRAQRRGCYGQARHVAEVLETELSGSWADLTIQNEPASRASRVRVLSRSETQESDDSGRRMSMQLFNARQRNGCKPHPSRRSRSSTPASNLNENSRRAALFNFSMLWLRCSTNSKRASSDMPCKNEQSWQGKQQ